MAIGLSLDGQIDSETCLEKMSEKACLKIIYFIIHTSTFPLPDHLS